MAVYLCPGFGSGFRSMLDANIPNSFGFLQTYQAGTSTPIATYTSSSGSTPNGSPVQLGATGLPPNEIWITGGTSIKVVVTDALGNPLPGQTYDNLTGIGDPSFILPLLSTATFVNSVAAIRLLSKVTNTNAYATAYYGPNPDGIGNSYQCVLSDTTSGAVFTGSIGGAVLTVSAVASGTLAVGQAVNRSDTGATVAYIASLGTGTGGIGTYNLNLSTTVGSMTMSSDNGGTILVGFDGGRWYLATSDSVCPEDFGAKGDGATNDGPCIQAMLQWVSEARGLSIAFKNKNYLTNVGIILPAVSGSSASSAGLTIYGNGGTLTMGASSTYLLAPYNWVSNINSSQAPVNISDLNLNGNSLATNGLVVQNYYSTYTNVRSYSNLGPGILQAGSTSSGTTLTGSQVNIRYENCWAFNNGTYGLRVADPSAGLSINTDYIVDGGYYYSNGDENIYCDNANGAEFTNVHLFYSGVNAGFSSFHLGSVFGTRLVGCVLESDTSGTKPCLEIAGGTDPLGITLSGNSFWSRVHVGFASGLKAVTFSGNVFETANGHIYHANNSSSCWIVSEGNTFNTSSPIQFVGSSCKARSVNDWVQPLGCFFEGEHTASATTPGYAYYPPVELEFQGDNSLTMSYTNAKVQMYSAALTAARTVAAPSNVAAGSRLRIVRMSGATGAFNLNIPGSLALTAASQYYDIIFDGTVWRSIGNGAV